MSAPALAVFAYLWSSERFKRFARLNLLTQLAVFIPAVQIPAFLTGRLSYVDIAWPTGLFFMGIVNLGRAIHRAIANRYNKDRESRSEADAERPSAARAVLIALAYVFQGGRMALGAWTMFLGGHLRTEMQRYTYQRRRWGAAGIVSGSFAEKLEIQVSDTRMPSTVPYPTLRRKRPSLNA